jgi:hypothetical protein
MNYDFPQKREAVHILERLTRIKDVLKNKAS